MKSNRSVKAQADSSDSIPPKNTLTFFPFFFFSLCEEVNGAPSHLFCSSRSTCSKRIRKQVTSRKGDKLSYSWQPFKNLAGPGCREPGASLSVCARYCTILVTNSPINSVRCNSYHPLQTTFHFELLNLVLFQSYSQASPIEWDWITRALCTRPSPCNWITASTLPGRTRRPWCAWPRCSAPPADRTLPWQGAAARCRTDRAVMWLQCGVQHSGNSSPWTRPLQHRRKVLLTNGLFCIKKLQLFFGGD